jgi:hypothetical protein
MDIVQTATGGMAIKDDVSGAANPVVMCLSGTIARTDTSAKTLGTLPQNAVIVATQVHVPTVSNAATTATVSVGKSGGTGVEYVNTVDVKSAAGVIALGTKGTLGSVGASAVTVTGVYAETGTASTSGGPFNVSILYILA